MSKLVLILYYWHSSSFSLNVFSGFVFTSVENLEFLEFVYFSFKAWPWMGGGGVLDLSWGRGVPPGP